MKEVGLTPCPEFTPPTTTEAVRKDFLEEAAFEMDLKAEKGFLLAQEEKTQAGEEIMPETPARGGNLVLFLRIDGPGVAEEQCDVDTLSTPGDRRVTVG